MYILFLGLKRWLRSAPEVLITLLLVCAIVAVPLASSTSRMLVRDAVSSHWRGTYDILVLAQDSPVVREHEGKTYIEPNYGVLTSPSIGQDQVEELASLPEVEVSAPIGFIGRMADSRENVSFQIPIEYLRKNPFVIMRAEYTIGADDGLLERRASNGSMYWRIDARNWDGQPSNGAMQNPTLRVDTSSLAEGSTWALQQDYLSIALGVGPNIATLLTAVDPVAEAQLLGQSAPEGLEKLTAFESVIDTVYADNDYTVPLDQLTGGEPWLEEITNLAPQFPGSYATRGYFTHQARFVPVLFAENVYPRTRMMAQVETIEVQNPESDEWLAESLGAEGQELATFNYEVTDDMRPLGHSNFALVLDGAGQIDPRYLIPANSPKGTGRSTLSSLTYGAKTPLPESAAEYLDTKSLPQVELQGIAKADPQNSLEGNPDGALAGQSTVYRQTEFYDSDLNMGASVTGNGNTAPVLVGGYDPSSITEAHGYSSPLGAYSTLGATRLTDGSGGIITPQNLAPTFTGRGLVAQPATALTSIATAQHMGVENPVTAVRLRLSNLDEYTEENISRLQATVQQVESLGLSAYIVAGASTAYEQAWVGSYAYGTDQSRGIQQVAPLGVVELPYTELGVAGDIVAQLAGLTEFLVLTAFLLGLGSLLALLALNFQTQRSNMVTLHAQGFTAVERWGYLLAERAPTLAVLAGGACVSTWLDPAYGGYVLVGTVLTAVIMVCLLGVIASGVKPVLPSNYRLNRIFPLGVMTPLALAMIAVILMASYAAVPAVLARVAVTELGQRVSEQTLPVFIGLMTLSFLTVTVLVSSAWSAGLAERISALNILWEQGFTLTLLIGRVLKEWLLALAISLLVSTVLYLGLINLGGGTPGVTQEELPLVWVLLVVVLFALPLLALYMHAIRVATKAIR